MPWVSKKSLEIYEKEIAFWRAQYERERDRVERMQDSFLQINGVPPASVEGLKVEKKRKGAQVAMMESIKELFAEEVGHMELSDDEKAELQQVGVVEDDTVPLNEGA